MKSDVYENRLPLEFVRNLNVKMDARESVPFPKFPFSNGFRFIYFACGAKICSNVEGRKGAWKRHRFDPYMV